MDDLDKELKRLSKITPELGFIKASKTRLLHQISLDKEVSWFQRFVKGAEFTGPSISFIQEARMRLMSQIRDLPQPVKIPLRGLAYFLSFIKKAVASTLAMVIAVTAVLFQLEGNTVVEASNDSYLEVTSGQVFLKHNDSIQLEAVKNQIQVRAGDLIEVKSGSEAVLHFFDDTQVRLNENSTFRISQLDFSAAFSDQAVIETVLEKGEVWVQSLSIDDGYAGFTMHTREAILNTLNSAFSVKTLEEGPTEVAVFKGNLSVSAFSLDKGQLVKKTYVTADKMLNLTFDETANAVFTEADIVPEVKDSPWVQGNLEKDQKHLIDLQEKDYNRLTLMAGTLPGDFLYPIKQAKELLRLELSDVSDSSVKIEIANNRLNEAIILFERGENEKGQQALEAYQKLAREILDANNKPENSEKLITQLVVPHQKVLSTQPSDKNSIKVKETLQATAEILAQNPLELEDIKLKNSVANLKDILALVEGGETELAKEKMAKYKTFDVQTNLLDGLQDQAIKREAYEEILNLKQEEKDLLAMVSEKTSTLEKGNEEFVAMVEVASKEAAVKTDEIRLAALPVLPELAQQIEVDQKNNESNPSPEVVVQPEVLDSGDSAGQDAKTIADRINIYTAWNGQFNQIQRLLGTALEDPSKISFLLEVQKYLDGRAKNYINTRILQLQSKLELEKETLNESVQESIPIESDVLPSQKSEEILNSENEVKEITFPPEPIAETEGIKTELRN